MGQKRSRPYKRVDMNLVRDLHEDGARVSEIARLLDQNQSSISNAIARIKRQQEETEQIREGSQAYSPNENGNGAWPLPGSNLSRSGAFHKGPPAGKVIRLPDGLKKLRKTVPNMDTQERNAFKNAGVGEAYSLTRRLAQCLDGLWRDGDTQERRQMAGEAISYVHKIEDVMTKAVGQTYTHNDHRTFG